MPRPLGYRSFLPCSCVNRGLLTPIFQSTMLPTVAVCGFAHMSHRTRIGINTHLFGRKSYGGVAPSHDTNEYRFPALDPPRTAALFHADKSPARSSAATAQQPPLCKLQIFQQTSFRGFEPTLAAWQPVPQVQSGAGFEPTTQWSTFQSAVQLSTTAPSGRH